MSLSNKYPCNFKNCIFYVCMFAVWSLRLQKKCLWYRVENFTFRSEEKISMFDHIINVCNKSDNVVT